MPFIIIIGAIIIAGFAALSFFLYTNNTDEVNLSEQEQVIPADEAQVGTLTRDSELESNYQDGSYVASARFWTPKRIEHEIEVRVDIEDNIITDANVVYDGEEPSTPSNIRFDAVYKDSVIGVKIDDIDVSRLGGASLTTDAFNEALGEIKKEASLYDTN